MAIQYDKYGTPYDNKYPFNYGNDLKGWFSTREGKEISDFCHRVTKQVHRFMNPEPKEKK